MNIRARRRITRKETYALIAGVTGLALACVVVSWGVLTLLLHRQPVSTADVPSFAAPVVILVSGLLLAWMLWQQTLVLLRGNLKLPWQQILVSSLGSFLLWCLSGMALGMSIADTWLSPFAWAVAGIWGTASLLTWVLFLHRIYGDELVWQWPWEKTKTTDPGDEVRSHD